MTFQPLLETAAALVGPVDLVDDLTFSSKAQVARLRVPGGATVVAKRPVDSAAFTRELEALRVCRRRSGPLWWPRARTF